EPGGVEALLAFLRGAADEAVAEGLVAALARRPPQPRPPPPAPRAAPPDAAAPPRARAGEAVGPAAAPPQALRPPPRHPPPRAPEPRVRLPAARALPRHGERAAMPVVLALLTDGPVEDAYQAEYLLCQLLATDEAPPATLTHGDAPARQKARDAWEAWWGQRG